MVGLSLFGRYGIVELFLMIGLGADVVIIEMNVSAELISRRGGRMGGARDSPIGIRVDVQIRE